MLDGLRRTMQSHHELNIRTVPGAIDDPGLPRNMLDLILLVDIYHEFSEPEMLDHIESLAHPGSESA
jgi:hypothetical protein